MVVHKIEIIDRDKENEMFIGKMIFFFKFVLPTFAVGIFVGIKFGETAGLISGIAVFILILLRKKIYKLFKPKREHKQSRRRSKRHRSSRNRIRRYR